MKINQKKFRSEKGVKRIGDKLCVKRKRNYNSLFSWIYKKRHSVNKSIFLKPKCLVELKHIFNKSRLKKWVDISPFAKKVDLENSISNVDKLDISKYKNVSSNLSVGNIK